jgi:hypothetical protein
MSSAMDRALDRVTESLLKGGGGRIQVQVKLFSSYACLNLACPQILVEFITRPRNPYSVGSLSTVDLLMKISCFEKIYKYVYTKKLV